MGIIMNSKFDEYFKEGFNLLYTDNYEKAISLLQKALDLKPNDSIVLDRIGYGHLMLENYEEAEKYFKKSLEIKPDNTLTLVDYGLLFQNQGDLQKAQQFYRKAIDIDDNNEYALRFMGNLYLIQGKNDLALEYYDKYLKLDNEDPYVLTSKSIALIRLGRTSEALEVVDESIKIDSKIYMSWINKSIIAFLMDNIDDEIKYAKKALDLEPDNCQALFHLKEGLKSKGLIKEAKEYEKKMLQTDCIIFEKQLENNLLNNLNLLEKYGFKLQLIKNQYSCKNSSGNNRFIDILCKDTKKNSYVIIELKIVEASIDTYNQIKEYMDIIKADNKVKNINGIVISYGANQEFQNKVKEENNLFQINAEDLDFEIY
jgi:tetratricopeptide (TPR) repeat protein